jgi:tetratricopeptide (TPR) repeat protein
MATHTVSGILDDYASSLNQLEVARDKQKIRADHVLAILVIRDDVQRTIVADGCELSTAAVQRLIELDEQLRKNAGAMTQVVRERQLSRWRSTVNAEEKAWWWWLERVTGDHPLNRFDGLWKLLMVAGWTANITLMVNLAARFLGGGVGLAGVAAVALPSVLGLLQVGTEFTKAGKEGFDRFLGMVRIPQQWREEVKLGLTLAMFGLLCGMWLQLPEFSKAESRSGVKSFLAGKVGDAEQSFLKAIALDGDNADAHYNLGSLYDRLEQPDKAKKEYLIAIAGNLPDAYNNLARLYIKEKKPEKYSQAAALLIQAIDKLDGQEKIAPKVRYDLHKNLGWVRFEQKRLEEAREMLKVAIGIAEQSSSKSSVKPSAAHCLLAQVLEQQKQPAVEEWRKCQKLGSVTEPDEDAWLYQAQQKLKNR